MFIKLFLIFYFILFSLRAFSNINETRNFSEPEHILSYNFMQSLKAKFYSDNPNWAGLVGMIPLSLWSHNTSDNSIGLWRVPLDINYPMKALNDNIEYAVSQAESVVYISTLWFTPGNETEEALKRAIINLNRKSFYQQKPIYVRLIFSMYKALPTPIPRVSERVLNYLLPEELSPYFDLSVINYRNPLAFNHSKIIAIDSNKLITGGINFSDKDYEDLENPVNDLSIELNLPYIADLGRIYLSKVAFETHVGDDVTINSIACTHVDKSDCTVSKRWYETSLPQLNIFSIPQIFENYDMEYVMSAGKMMDNKNHYDADFSSYAILSLLENAQREINISQQSIIGVPLGNRDMQIASCGAIGNALMRGVNVNIVLSAYQSVTRPDLGYSENATSDDAMVKCIIKNTKEIYKLDPTQALPQLNILRVARWFNAPPYYIPLPYGTAKNHVKLVMVDDQMAYIGSENLYYNSHTEFGVIVNSRLLIAKIKNEYWNPTVTKSIQSFNRTPY